MYPTEVSHKASLAEEDSLVMGRWKAESGHSQETASSTINPIPDTSPSTHTPSVSGVRNHPPLPFDHTGQLAPPGIKPNVVTTHWEDEGCLCFLVEVRGVRVARREDDHMINGTKLLNVAGLARSRRDNMLKSEKSRRVVRTGPMNFKGVWIPFERALEIANKERITELLYPLFLSDIGSMIRQPSTRKGASNPESERKTLQVAEWSKGNEEYAHQIEAVENNDESLWRFPSDTLKNYELYEQGPIGSLYKSLMETLGLILIEIRMQPDMTQYYGSLEKSCAALFFWGTDLGLWRGELDDMLQDSPQLRDTCLTVLVSICQFVGTSLIQMINSEHRQKKVLQSTGISTSLEQAVNMIDEQHHSTYQLEKDAETLCQTLRTKIDTLIMLAPSLESPAEENFDDEEPRAIRDVKEHLPEQAYANSISQKFPLAASAIVIRLGKLNWDRYNHMLRLQRETMQQELQIAALEKARTIFHDSGLGVSLPTQSESGVENAANPSCPESVYAPSVVSSRAEASHKRIPPLPAHARTGEPFTCEICNKQVKFRRTKAWKKHVFDDILAYACFFAECCDTRVFFENNEALMNHLEDHHDMDVRVSDVTCPLCIEFTSRDRNDLSLHVARHMEEVALAVLPSGVESDEESGDGSVSEVVSGQDDNIYQSFETKVREVLDPIWKKLGLNPKKLKVMTPQESLASLVILGSNHPEMLGPFHSETLKFVTLQESLASVEKTLGRKHPETLKIVSQLMVTLNELSKDQKAEAMDWQMLDRYSKGDDYQESVSGNEAKRGSEANTIEPRYCHCNKAPCDDMIACGNDDCSRVWFHLECVDLEKVPSSQWFCSDECKDTHTLASTKRGTRPPSLEPLEKSWPIPLPHELVVGMPGSSNDPPQAQPGAKPEPSSYWSVAELQDFDRNIAHFGTDWGAIANHMGTKTCTMIKNQYLRLVESGELGLEQMAKEADARRDRGEDIGPPPTPSPAPKRRYEASAQPIAPTHLVYTPPAPSPLEAFVERMAKEADAYKLLNAGVAPHTEVCYRRRTLLAYPETGPIIGLGLLCRINSVICEGKQRRYELIGPKWDLGQTSPFLATEDELALIPSTASNNTLDGLHTGERVVALYPGDDTFVEAEVVTGWSSGEAKGNLVHLRLVGKRMLVDVERRYVFPMSTSE